MPKSKEFVESDSSSGSDSDAESGKKGKKRAKKEIKQKESKGSSTSKKSKSNELMWDLGDKCQINIREFKGKKLIDIRVMYEDDEGELRPGKKGIAMSPKLWRNFMKVVEEVDKAVEENC